MAFKFDRIDCKIIGLCDLHPISYSYQPIKSKYFNTTLILIIQYLTYNLLYLITIIATIAAIVANATHTNSMIIIQLIKFDAIDVNLAVYCTITLVVSDITNIFFYQILYSKKFDTIPFCLSIECTVIVYFATVKTS